MTTVSEPSITATHEFVVPSDHLIGVGSYQDFALPGDERYLGQDRVVFAGSKLVCHELDRSRVPDDAQGYARRLALLETVSACFDHIEFDYVSGCILFGDPQSQFLLHVKPTLG